MAVITISSHAETFTSPPKTLISKTHLHHHQTLLRLLQNCSTKNLNHLKSIHAQILKSTSHPHHLLLNKLLDKCSFSKNAMDYALQLFDQIPQPHIFFWNVIFKGLALNNLPIKTIFMYTQMLETGIFPDNYTFPMLLKACSCLNNSLALAETQQIHAQIIKIGIQSDLYVCNSLMNAYSKCENLQVARQIFDRTHEKNVVSWNSMITNYAKSSAIENAHQLFDEMPERNDVSTWNCLISGYLNSEDPNSAIRLFRKMQHSNVKPDSVTLVSVLSACTQLGAISLGTWIHKYICKNNLDSNLYVKTALLNLYAKCGNIEMACVIFDQMHQRDVVAWTVMIEGYALHGLAEEAFEIFDRMEREGIKPDSTAFTGLLCACSYSGMIEKGLQIFKRMSLNYGLEPSLEHYGCLVDLLGRHGFINEAHDLIITMPIEPNHIVWGALLGACRIHNNVEMGEVAASKLFKLGSQHCGYYTILSNIYASSCRWDDVSRIRAMMRDNGIKKLAGWSCIELDNVVHEFVAGDTSHADSDRVHAGLKKLLDYFKMMGYVPDVESVLRDVDECEKEHVVSSHSERLAVVFGLINTSPGSIIRVVKNLRICYDCHVFLKMVSRVVEREIVIRDNKRFHHFKEGSCSCKDYW